MALRIRSISVSISQRLADRARRLFGKLYRRPDISRPAADVRPPRIFIDMDGVLVDFEAYARDAGLDPNVIKRTPGSYLGMKPYPGALESVRLLIAMGFECWIATRLPTGVPTAYTEKAQWVSNYLPELANRVIVTPDKGLLGSERDYLIDDRPHKANCQNFPGRLLHFAPGLTWVDIVQFFRTEQRKLDLSPYSLPAQCDRVSTGPTC